MGQSKGGGYTKKEAVSPKQLTYLNKALKEALANQQAASEGFKQFLPGGQGGQPIIDAANKNFQQQTLPSILNAFGTDNKGSSSLNQALAAGASNLNTDLASQIAQMQLSASQGIGNIGQGQATLGSQTNQFAYMPRQQPFWQSALLGGVQGGGNVLGGWLGGGR